MTEQQFKAGNPVRVKGNVMLSESIEYAGMEGEVIDCYFGMVEVQFETLEEFAFFPDELELIK